MNSVRSVSEFNEFKLRFLIPQKQVLIERRLKSWKNEYKFKWNHKNLSRGLNLNRGSNSLNSASDNLSYLVSSRNFVTRNYA